MEPVDIKIFHNKKTETCQQTVNNEGSGASKLIPSILNPGRAVPINGSSTKQKTASTPLRHLNCS